MKAFLNKLVLHPKKQLPNLKLLNHCMYNISFSEILI